MTREKEVERHWKKERKILELSQTIRETGEVTNLLVKINVRKPPI